MRLRRAQRRQASTMCPARRFLGAAANEARTLGHGYIGTEHLLLALMASRTGSASVTLERLGIASDQSAIGFSASSVSLPHRGSIQQHWPRLELTSSRCAHVSRRRSGRERSNRRAQPA